MTQQLLASQLLAADTHNVLNAGTSWTDPASWEQKLGNAGKFISASILSGVNSFYNTAATVGSWIDPSVEERDTEKWITSLDQDLGQYYRANKQVVDVTGFVVSSIIPGLGGAKLFNMGQKALATGIKTGKISGNTAALTGLLLPKRAQYLDESADLIKASVTSSNLLNAKTYQALAAGAYQNTLEAVAGEVLILATMAKSPVLDDMDSWDLVKNVAIGGAFGGVVGGAIDAAKGIGFLRKVRDAEDLARQPWLRTTEIAEKTAPADKAILVAEDLENLAAPIKRTLPENASAAEITAVEREYKVTRALWESRVSKDLNSIRTNMHELAGSNTTHANMIADLLTPVRTEEGLLTPGFSKTIYENLTGTAGITQIKKTHPLEDAAGRAEKQGKAPEVPIAVRYVKLTGEDAGTVLEAAPKIRGLGDMFTSPAAIQAVVSSKKFTSEKLFDYATLTGPDAHVVAQLRTAWAKNVTLKPDMRIHANDIALLTKAYEENFTAIKVVSGEGPTLEVFTPTTKQELYQYIKEAKAEIAANQVAVGKKLNYSGDEILQRAAVIADVNPNWLQGNHATNEFDDIFASAATSVRYQKFLSDRGLSTETIDPFYKPQYAKVIYALDKRLTDTHESMADALTYLKTQQIQFVAQARRVTAKAFGKFWSQLPDITEKEMLRANSRGAGATLLAGANSNYGTLGSATTQIGKITAEISQQRVKDATEALTPALQKLGTKPEVALEFSAINQKLQRSDRLFVLANTESGQKGLFDRNLMQQLAKDPEFSGAVPDELLDSKNWITIKSDETYDAWLAHSRVEGDRTLLQNEMRSAQGKTSNKFDDVVRPIRQNPRDYPFYAFVYDPRINNSGHVSMIHAASEKELAQLIDAVPTHFKVTAAPEVAARIKVRTKLEVESYYKARNEFEFDRTLNENYINSELASKGIYSDYFPPTDPQKIINGVLQHHTRQERLLAQELMRLHYQPVFDVLEDMGKEYSKYATSRFASRTEMLERTTDNPYFNYIKQALNISNINESHLLYGFNKMLDEATSRAYGAITKATAQARKPEDLELVNKVLEEQGILPVPYDAALDALANHTAPKGVLTSFVRKANAMLSTVVLGLDPLNALTNALGSTILRNTELSSVLRAVKAGNQELAGELSELAKVKLPGVDAEMLSPVKLMHKAIDNLFKKPELMKKYRDMGIIKDRVEQLHLLVDDFTLTGTETVAEIAAKEASAWQKFKALAAKAAEGGEKWTGNKFVEEANRFISANVMDQITELAIKHGVMNQRTAQSYINTFVNRVEGSILASQRPLMFQGPLGQAIGLFQRYQFNLLQQMFRYVSEGSKKDVAILMGMQGSIFGLQSLPGFQFINTHILGTASGNPEHRDLYTYTYGTMGVAAGDFLLYGIPSNLLKANLYTRGDINPRHLTIIPTNPQEYPLVQGWGKFISNLFDTAGKIRAGGDVTETLIQGLEHNGISRPLAGFAQTMQAFGPNTQVYSTTKQGSILYSNDLLSFATLVRLAGGRPLDEARTNDGLWRVKAYEASRRERMKSHAEVVKSQLIQGNEPSEEDIQRFAEKYAELGGKQERFNSWMLKLYTDANTPQSEQIRSSLTNPFAQHMQLLMGGEPEE